jgi:hypothetical protein
MSAKHKPRDRNSMPSIQEADALTAAVREDGVLIEFDWDDNGHCVWTTRSLARKALSEGEIAHMPQRVSWCAPKNTVETMMRLQWLIAADTPHERRRAVTDLGRAALERWRAKNKEPQAA